MKKAMFAAALVIGAMAAGPVAQAGDVSVGIGIGLPGVVWGGPAYYPPPPVYYYGGPPVYVAPRPVYVPAPGYYYGWRGRGHWDRGRHGDEHWGRRGDRGHWHR
ncbi:MAG: hypothetical protein EPN31_04385 [Castellaniella sp.]|uniref:hypothetical protein n=1 Tax=Castellaniella sp. TaxID=1955812 RepID=UPI0012144F22|nr:hypothetical protein [Castellaniella sp.]TAN30318.1 MAG: hypothetical protein EPN31_04385 [Castellaniella sp.]